MCVCVANCKLHEEKKDVVESSPVLEVVWDLGATD